MKRFLVVYFFKDRKGARIVKRLGQFARRLLIACNVNLATRDLELAKRIARKIRASSGGFPYVKALGLDLASRGLVQVSLNITHHEVSPLHTVYEAIRSEAEQAGVEVAETELIGFIPRAAAQKAADFLSHCAAFQPSKILENRISALNVVGSGGNLEFCERLARSG